MVDGRLLRADVLIRTTERGLLWAYYMKLHRFCGDRWQRIATRTFLQGVTSFRRNSARRTMSRYWYKLQYFKYFKRGGKQNVAGAAATGSGSIRRGVVGFRVRAATDVFGVKKNIMLQFGPEQPPAIRELVNAIESQFDSLVRASRPTGFPDVPYHVSTVQVFDRKLSQWVDLASRDQLETGCQLFCFTPESCWHSDSPGVIPEAEEVYTWITEETSPHRNRLPVLDRNQAPAGDEKARFVFFDMCRVGHNSLSSHDLSTGFFKCSMVFEPAMRDQLFTDADENGDGAISLDEWQRFAASNPNILDALYFRTKDLYANPRSSALGGHSHLSSSLAAYNDPLGPVIDQDSTAKIRLAAEYQIACQEADSARSAQRIAEAREAKARERLKQIHY